MAEHVERIGARIRARREELELSRPKLVARMAGVVTENDLYRWERGQHRPHDDTLEELARALEVDVSYFFAQEEDDEPRSPDLIDALKETPVWAARLERKLDDVLALLRSAGGGGEDLPAVPEEAPTPSPRVAGRRRSA